MAYWLEYRTLDRKPLGVYGVQPKARAGSTCIEITGEQPAVAEAVVIEADGTVHGRVPDACTTWTAAAHITYATNKKAAKGAARVVRTTALAALKATGHKDVKDLIAALGL